MSILTENGLHGNFTYLIWHGSIPDYKNITIWKVVLFFIINSRFTRNKLDNRSN